MARKVKCCDTLEYSTSDQAWKAPNGKYWSTEGAFIKHTNNESYRKKCIQFVCEQMSAVVVPAYLVKRLKDFPDYEVVYTILVNTQDTIRWAIENKNFKNEASIIQYVMAIVSNNYNMTSRQIKKQESKQETIDEPIDISVVNNIQKSRDISSFLDED